MPYVALSKHTKPCGVQVMQVADYYNEPDWDNSCQIDWETHQFSEKMRKVYQIIRVTVDHIPYLEQLIPNIGHCNGGLGGIDWLEKASGFKELRQSIAGGTPTPILDMRGMSVDCWLMDNSLIEFEYIEDTATWTGGDVTIGSGEDYTTISASATDMGTFTSNGVATISSNTTETVQAYWNDDNGIYDIEYVNGDPHLGDPTSGYKCTASHNNNWFYISMSGSGGDFIIDGLQLAFNNVNTSEIIYTLGGANSHDLIVRNCLLNKYGGTGNCIYNRDTGMTLKAYCNKMWGVAGSDYTVEDSTGNAGTLENNTIYNTTAWGVVAGAGFTYRNNIIVVGNYSFWNNSDDYGYNNYSSQTYGENSDFSTGSGNITSGTTAVFESTTDTDSDFLASVADSAIDDAATTPTLWTTDIAGNSYNGTIGAQQIAASGVVLGLFIKQMFPQVFRQGMFR